MKPHLPPKSLETLAHKLTAIDAEIRSIRATLFQLAEATTSPESNARERRTAEDDLERPD